MWGGCFLTAADIHLSCSFTIKPIPSPRGNQFCLKAQIGIVLVRKCLSGPSIQQAAQEVHTTLSNGMRVLALLLRFVGKIH